MFGVRRGLRRSNSPRVSIAAPLFIAHARMACLSDRACAAVTITLVTPAPELVFKPLWRGDRGIVAQMRHAARALEMRAGDAW